MTVQQIENSISTLSIEDRLYLMRRLIDSIEKPLETPPSVEDNAEPERQNPLMKWAGMFSSGEPDDVSERVEEILLDAADPITGFRK